ncbi:MAG: nitrogenase-stabilizing/protective protein NifW [Cyanobacteria bacterium P01_H01_bin.15]
MTKTLGQFNRLKNAEEYFEFLGVKYDQQILNVHRLHILRKFSELTESIEPTLDEEQRLNGYREALQAAYDLFLTSSGVEQKLFQVFRDQPKNLVKLSDITVE